MEFSVPVVYVFALQFLKHFNFWFIKMSAFEALSFIAGQAEKSIIDMQEDLGQVSKILSKLEDFTNIRNKIINT